MQQTCRITGHVFEISDAEQAFCQREGIPLPTIHPRERMRQQLIFRNRKHLYHDVCALTKKPMLSCFPPERGLMVYDVDVWESDQWDPLTYGQAYDFSRPFFEQFSNLLHRVPLSNRQIGLGTIENSYYTNGVTGAKNCYLLFGATYNEDCLFGHGLWYSKDVVDSVYVHKSELCYDCVNIRDCYNLKYSSYCTSCSDSVFLFNCQSCKHCFGCVNKSNAEYCFYNEQLTKE